MAQADDPTDPKPTPQSAAPSAAPSAAAAEVKALGRLVSEAAHSLLDGVETLLLGRVGAADDAIREAEGDPLTRLRAERALDDERPRRRRAASGACDNDSFDGLTLAHQGDLMGWSPLVWSPPCPLTV